MTAPTPPDIAEIITGIGEELIKCFDGATVLISGGRGFLGRYIVRTLQEIGETARLHEPPRLIVLDNFITSGDLGAMPAEPRTAYVVHNVQNPFVCDEPLTHIISAAGIASPYWYKRYPLQTIDGIVGGTRNMLELARQHGSTLIYVSTSEIYGDPVPEAVPTPETYCGNVNPLGERSVYDEAKRLGETLCSTYTRHFGVKTRIVRPFNCFGPGLRKDDYRVMPNFVSSAIAGLPLTVYRPGTQTRTFCYVTDMVAGLFRALLLGRDAEAYNVGNTTPEITISDLAARISEVAATTGLHLTIHEKDRPSVYSNEPQRRCPDIARARDQLGYQPRVALDEGIRRFLDWAIEAYSA